MKIGYFLSCEEYDPQELISQARMAQKAGFDSLWISDHFHPWNSTQGQSPFVWGMIGAISRECDLPISTAVTCPTTRVHPAIIAQAAATSAVLTQGKFILGVGSGEALNEHVTGARWPETAVRLEMLEESLEVIRALWTGETVSHHGQHYTVEDARLFTRTEEPPPIYISGFGAHSAELARRIGDGYITTQPDKDLIEVFRKSGGEGKPVQAGYKVCWGEDDDASVAIAHRLGELGVGWRAGAQALPSWRHFEQAGEIVPEQKLPTHWHTARTSSATWMRFVLTPKRDSTSCTSHRLALRTKRRTVPASSSSMAIRCYLAYAR